MERKIIITEDGSHSISIPEISVTYHSTHGAIQESQHVFIQAGVLHLLNDPKEIDTIRIFEMGLGTGLNVLLTLIETQKRNLKVYYEAIDLFPLKPDEAKQLNYCEQLNCKELQTVFEQIHFSDLDKETQLSPSFIFRKSTTNLLNLKFPEPLKFFKLIYFDAFDPNVQPELWTKDIFDKMFSMLEPGGVLVTYSSKGDVRRAMQAAGFTIEKIPGPKKKREMIRGTKIEAIQTNN